MLNLANFRYNFRYFGKFSIGYSFLPVIGSTYGHLHNDFVRLSTSSPTPRLSTSSSTACLTRTSRFSLATASLASRDASEPLLPGLLLTALSHAPRTDAAATTSPTDPGTKQQISAWASQRSPMSTLLIWLLVLDLLVLWSAPPRIDGLNKLQ